MKVLAKGALKRRRDAPPRGPSACGIKPFGGARPKTHTPTRKVRMARFQSSLGKTARSPLHGLCNWTAAQGNGTAAPSGWAAAPGGWAAAPGGWAAAPGGRAAARGSWAAATGRHGRDPGNFFRGLATFGQRLRGP